MKCADLHLHTVYSDSTYTPEVLVASALRVELSCISVVDHDTVKGIEPVIACAKSQGIEVIPGIELTCEHEGKEVHMLGYLLDHQDPVLIQELELLKVNRIERIHKISAKLKDLGINLDADKVFALAPKGTVSRLHVGQAMVKEGIVRTLGEAFQKYIGDRCPGYVGGFRLSAWEAIQLIKKFKGIAVLAHPYILARDELIAIFVEYGLSGLEVYYPEHSQPLIRHYLEVAKKYNLLATGGSDCHGLAKPAVQIGTMKIPYELVEKLKSARDTINP